MAGLLLQGHAAGRRGDERFGAGAVTVAMRSSSCDSERTPKPIGVIFPVNGSARKTAGTCVTCSVREMPLSRRNCGKFGRPPPSTLIGTIWIPWRAWKASSVGAKAWQYGQSERKKKNRT